MDEPLKPASAGAPGSRVVQLETRDELPSRLPELGLRRPRPVVVLVGGADGLGDARLARLRPLFEEGLAPLADSLGACVIDGGTDAGVMAMVGHARAKLGASFPLVGVAASGTVEPADGTGRQTGTSSLEPNHTHLVLVPGTRWGAESPWLAEVATWLAGDDPSVTVVVNGGEVTLDDAARSVDAGRPGVATRSTCRRPSPGDHEISTAPGPSARTVARTRTSGTWKPEDERGLAAVCSSRTGWPVRNWIVASVSASAGAPSARAKRNSRYDESVTAPVAFGSTRHASATRARSASPSGG